MRLKFCTQSHLRKLTGNRFDRFLLLNNLSREPNFRWCLACESGELFDSGSLQPRIRCDNCEFEMCFRCGVPWHTSVTCKEFQSDPQFAATRALIQSNTKACPGPNCSTRIEKGAACFHMSENPIPIYNSHTLLTSHSYASLSVWSSILLGMSGGLASSGTDGPSGPQ